jgi:transposase
MQGRREQQLTFSDALWTNQIPKDSYWSKISAYLLGMDDSVFGSLFSHTGRPSTSPVHTFGAMLIQLEKGWSDRELEEAHRFDDRVKCALEVSRDFAGINAVTLCEHRIRFIESGVIFTLFTDLLSDAKAKDPISEDKLQIVIDSFMVYGAGAIQDTYTLLRKGIV